MVHINLYLEGSIVFFLFLLLLVTGEISGDEHQSTAVAYQGLAECNCDHDFVSNTCLFTTPFTQHPVKYLRQMLSMQGQSRTNYLCLVGLVF